MSFYKLKTIEGSEVIINLSHVAQILPFKDSEGCRYGDYEEKIVDKLADGSVWYVNIGGESRVYYTILTMDEAAEITGIFRVADIKDGL